MGKGGALIASASGVNFFNIAPSLHRWSANPKAGHQETCFWKMHWPRILVQWHWGTLAAPAKGYHRSLSHHAAKVIHWLATCLHPEVALQSFWGGRGGAGACLCIRWALWHGQGQRLTEILSWDRMERMPRSLTFAISQMLHRRNQDSLQ